MSARSRDAVEAAKAALDHIDGWLAYRVWRTRVPGAQVAVWFDGRLQLARSFGVADVTTGEKLTNTHQFRIASHSKTFTATAIMQLAEAGALRLDDEVQSHVPALVGTPAADVTIRELLSHGAGVTRDSIDSTFWSLLRPFPDSAALSGILAEPLDVQTPGTGFKYTNIGFGILGLVIEHAAGRSYDEVVRDGIIKPLGLTRTVPDVDTRKSARYAGAHTGTFTDFSRTLLDNVSAGALVPATGFTSTASETARYFAAHLPGSGELLTDRSKRRMRQQQWPVVGRDGGAGGYGLGLAIREIDGLPFFGHGGGWPGHITRSLFQPDLGLVVTVLTNAIDGPAEELAAGVVRLILASQRHDLPQLSLGTSERAHGSAGAVPAASARRADLARFTGRCASPWTLVDIVQLGGSLYAIPPTASDPIAAAERLTVIDDDTLVADAGTGYSSIGEPIRFEWDARGRLQRLSGGWRLTPAPALVPYSQTTDG